MTNPIQPNDWSIIILAAGKGSRLQTKTPKPLVTVGGRPLIDTIIRHSQDLQLKNIVIVISDFTKKIKNYYQHPSITYVMAEPKGTGYAVQKGLAAVTTPYTLISGADDSFLYTKELLQSLMTTHTRQQRNITIAYFISSRNHPFISFKHRNNVLVDIYDNQASLRLPAPKDVPSGLFSANTDWLRPLLQFIPPDFSGEIPFPRVLRFSLENQQPVGMFQIEESLWHGVNTPEELQALRRKYRDFHQNS